MVLGLYDAVGQDVDLVAETLCRSRAWVDDRLLSQLWPAEFHEAVAAKELTLGAAKELMAITDAHDRMFYFGHARASGASVTLVRAWRQAWQISRVCVDPTASGKAASAIGPAPLACQLPCFFCGSGVLVEAIVHLRFCADCATVIADHRPDSGRRSRPKTTEDYEYARLTRVPTDDSRVDHVRESAGSVADAGGLQRDELVAHGGA